MQPSDRKMREQPRVTANDLALYMVSSATMQMSIETMKRPGWKASDVRSGDA